MSRVAFACVAVLALVACATTPELAAEELSYCQRMEREMGVQHEHDHTVAKGMGMDPMRVTHDRCRQMLGMS